MGFDYEKVEKAWFKPKKDIIKVNLDLKGIKNLEKYITDLEQNRYVLDELEEYVKQTKIKEFEKTYGKRYGKTFTQAEIIVCNMVLDKIQELKKKECR